LISDHQEQSTKLFNFGLAEEDWQRIVETFKGLALDKALSSNDTLFSKETFSLPNSWQSNMSANSYTEAFNQVQDYIQAGDCYQVNLAQRFQADFKGSPLAAYAKLTQANRAPFSAYLNFDDHQILSISPERFIESHNNLVITQPIKGTRPRKSDPLADKQQADELINSEKDRAENLMIVDLLRNDLSRTAAKGSVKVTELFGHYRFSSVHHLISTIESKLAEGFDNFDLLATTLPGGSITGAPKIRAMQIIEELEKSRRSIYCGNIAYLDFNGNMDSNITIRTLVVKNQKIYAWAGGGLVADSNCTEEYQETFDKLSKVLQVLSPDFSMNKLE
jgi:para-aminobenzoate synthetase component 1